MDTIDYKPYVLREVSNSTEATYVDEPYNFTIIDRKYTTPTVFILVLKDNKDKPFTGVVLGGHLRFFIPPASRKVEGHWNGVKDIESKDLVKRVYTPVLVDPDNKLLHFVIRVYEPCDKFCDGGRVSRTLADIPINSEISCMIVPGKLHYSPNQFSFKNNIYPVKEVAFIAGGTGITLFYRFIKSIIYDPTDTTKINLIFSVRNIDEIILHKALEEFNSPKLFKQYFVTNSKEVKRNCGNISFGYIDKEILTKIKNSCHFFICGPKPFNNYINDLLTEIGIVKESITLI